MNIERYFIEKENGGNKLVMNVRKKKYSKKLVVMEIMSGFS